MAPIPVDYLNIRPLMGSVVVPKQSAAAMTPGVSKLGYIDDNGKVGLCDADTVGTVIGRKLGLIVASSRANVAGNVAADEMVSFLEWGRVFLGENAAMDESKNVYASNTAGGIEQQIGTNTRRVGAPESDTILFFNDGTSAAGS